MSGRWAKLRLGLAEGPEQEDVLGRVAQVILAADHVADPHRGVVDDDAEVVERRAVGADDARGRHRASAASISTWPRTEVVEGHDPRLDPEADRRPATLGLEARPARPRSGGRTGRCSAAAGGPPRAACARRRARRRCSSSGRPGPRPGGGRWPPRSAAGAPSGDTGRTGRVGSSPATPGPRPRRARASAARRGCPARRPTVRARDVGVLQAQDERAADVPGEQVVEQRRPGGPDVERPGRARRDADAERSRDDCRSRPADPRPRGRRASGRAPSARSSGRGPGGRAPGRPRRAGPGSAPPVAGPSVARPRGPSSVSESSDSERARTLIARTRRQRPGLEVRQERRRPPRPPR